MLSRICRWQNYLDGSNNYWAAISQTETFLMDRESVEKLSRQIQKSRWIENAIRSIEKGRKKGSIDVKLSSLIKRSFFKERKTQRDECKQASYSNIDPINIIISQQKQCKAFIDPKHTLFLYFFFFQFFFNFYEKQNKKKTKNKQIKNMLNKA